MVWQTGSLAVLGGAGGDAGSMRAGLPRESPLASGHPAPTGSAEAAPNLHTRERAEHLSGSAEPRSRYAAAAGFTGGKFSLWWSS